MILLIKSTMYLSTKGQAPPTCGFLCRVGFISEEKKHHIAGSSQHYMTKIYVGISAYRQVTE